MKFEDLTSGDTFAPALGMSVVSCGRECPQFTNGTVSGEGAHTLTDVEDLRVGEFYGVLDGAQDEPTWWLAVCVGSEK